MTESSGSIDAEQLNLRLISPLIINISGCDLHLRSFPRLWHAEMQRLAEQTA